MPTMRQERGSEELLQRMLEGATQACVHQH